MNINLCTISFRNHLISIEELIEFAGEKGFNGIELWGIHAGSFLNSPSKIENTTKLLDRYNLFISMLSCYIDIICSREMLDNEIDQCINLIKLAHKIGTKKIRIFAGNKPSYVFDEHSKNFLFERLRLFSNLFIDQKIKLIIETHPNTFADTLETTKEMLDKVNHRGLAINLDFLHIWEAGDDPIKAYRYLKPHIAYCHLKNIISRDKLHVFTPVNVFGPRGDKDGIVNLAKGAIDYEPILKEIFTVDPHIPCSLEWFGHDPFTALSNEMDWITDILYKKNEIA